MVLLRRSRCLGDTLWGVATGGDELAKRQGGGVTGDGVHRGAAGGARRSGAVGDAGGAAVEVGAGL